MFYQLSLTQPVYSISLLLLSVFSTKVQVLPSSSSLQSAGRSSGFGSGGAGEQPWLGVHAAALPGSPLYFSEGAGFERAAGFPQQTAGYTLKATCVFLLPSSLPSVCRS